MDKKVVKIKEDSKKLNKEQGSIIHTYVMKGGKLCKRAQPNIYQAIEFLSQRVKDTNE